MFGYNGDTKGIGNSKKVGFIKYWILEQMSSFHGQKHYFIKVADINQLQ